MAENTQYQKVKEITDQLEQGIQDLFQSEKYMEWLKTMSKFHDYSLNNTLLIAFQKPDATLVAGYTAWQKEFGRQVMKGEKAIKILAPAPYKQKVEMDKIDPITQKPVLDAEGNPVKEVQEIKRPAFKVVNVFDVSQTDGKEIPSLGVNELTGDVQEYELFFEALKRTCPVAMEFEQIESGAKGYYHQLEQRIAIQEGMSQIQTIKTAIHEMAHQRLHAISPLEETSEVVKQTRSSKEVEAESVAYTVCQHYGIETSDYSFAYVAGWSHGKETPELKASLNTIRKTANEMITEIDAHIAEINKEMEQENKITCYLKITGSMGSEYEIDRIAGTVEQIEAALKEVLEKEIENIPEFLERKGIPVLAIASSIDDEPSRYIRPDYEYDIDRKQIYREGVAIGRELTREEEALRLAVKAESFFKETDNYQYNHTVDDRYEFMGELQKNLLEGNEKAEDVLGWFVQEMDAETDYSDPATDLYIEMKNFVKDGKEIYQQEQATKLATELYDYADEVDPYGSQDSVEYVDEFIRDTTKDLLDAGEKAEGIMKWLKETPVATEELEQRGKELIEKVSNFTGISMEQEATITFYVAECMEFPNLGECHENLTLDEAMKIYEKIPADRMNGIKGIGFELHDGSIYDGQFPLMQADKIDEDIINMVEHYKKSPLVQQAIADCKEMIERKQDFEFAKDLYENGFVYDDYVITSAEAYDLRQDGVEPLEFSDEQLKIIKKGLKEGLDITPINNPDLSVDEMKKGLREIRKEHRAYIKSLTPTEDGKQENGNYRYYSTQRPVMPGVYPKPIGNEPVEIVNYDSRQAVENGKLQAWGYLEYALPLSPRERDDYELKAVSVIEVRINAQDKNPEKKKSVLADLHDKQEKIAGANEAKKSRSKKQTKEMEQ
ncbi:ArdC-like ssDNA-binding domain-containing protein [Mediterraneibacter gnavus]|uniref:Uncharacterized protein n=1 Tax=Mediterraneibacter gnavus TaxID=33038 RepID=A0A2N5Q022_MEDGN|nr:ArdC-like ssDNA-binding domain-containing protein [Ruminococcus sp.]PLT86990.1 hypothetical protein CDL20_07615 [Mediterraneibacter gnavus]